MGERALVSDLHVSPENETANKPNHLKMTQFATVDAPTSAEELWAWIKLQAGDRAWFGRAYVARTICWHSDQSFRQYGSAPNYGGGLWSLATCKHSMRRSLSFKEELREKVCFIFTFARKSPVLGSQPLVSVACVEKLDSMKHYADWLLRFGTKPQVMARLSSEIFNDGLFSERFGDCHADLGGTQLEPLPGHVHYRNGMYERDIDDGAAVLVAKKFHVWKEPILAASRTLAQARFGIGINDKNIIDFIRAR